MSNLTSQAQSILDDLEHLDFGNPVLDKRIVEECFAEHFRLLGLPMLPVHWEPSLKKMRSYITKKKSKRNITREKALGKAKDAIPCGEYPKYDEVFDNTIVWSAVSISWELAWDIINNGKREILYSVPIYSALVDALDSAMYLNLNDLAAITYGNILFPFVGAVKAGLGFCWIFENEIVCCVAPRQIVKNKQLHSEIGPAVLWSNGEACYYYKGIPVTKEIIEKKFSWNEIEAEKNQEIRRVMLDIYGSERYIKESEMTPIHVDDFGTLYTKDREDGTTFAAVKVVNSTPEPDGSFKDYFIRVNPKRYNGDAGKIAHAAVASMWRTKDGKLAFKRWQEYCPAYET